MTVEQRLAQEIATREFASDASQLEVARRLDALSLALAERENNERRLPHVLGARLRQVLGIGRSSAAETPVRGLYIWGGVGRGKTHLMDTFFESLPIERRERQHFYRFMRDVHAELHDLKQVTDPLDAVAERIAARTRVICFDELFVSDIGDAMILSGLFTGLFARGVSLVATSNVAPKDLYKDGLQRQRFLPAIALIERHAQAVHLDGGIDYRLRHLQQGKTYLALADPSTPARMRKLFETLCGGSCEGAVTLRVEGREISAIDRGPGIAWFDFSQLCGGARSQNDYIDLAHDFHTLFISDVPVLDTLHENEARRFVMLVDEAYDRGVKLVVSAAAPPVELYRGERLKFEFERTSSRLIEMQAPAYLAREHRA